jgi:hypothetical protein
MSHDPVVPGDVSQSTSRSAWRDLNFTSHPLSDILLLDRGRNYLKRLGAHLAVRVADRETPPVVVGGAETRAVAEGATACETKPRPYPPRNRNAPRGGWYGVLHPRIEFSIFRFDLKGGRS